MLYRIRILVICLGLSQAAAAQSNEGTEFWFSFMEHLNIGQNTMAVMITSKYNTSGTIRIPLQNWQQTFTVPANGVTIVNMPTYAETLNSESIDDNAIQITSNLPVSVYMHQFHSMRSEASVVLPVTSVGSEYYVLTYSGYTDQSVHPSEFVVVGMEDDTKIDIHLSAATEGGLAAGSTVSVVLDKGQTYLVQAQTGSGDFSGTHISGDKKFNVFAGATWTQVPAGCLYRDNLLEQMFPVATWGKKFVSVPFAHMPYDLFRVIASEDGTTVTVKGSSTQTYTLNAGQYAEFQSSAPTLVTGNKPISVAQYLIGSNCSGYTVGDPSMLMLNSVEQIRDTVTFYNSKFENITENYIALVTKSSDVATTLFDGQLLTSTGATIQKVNWDTTFSWARLQVQAGAHTIISQGCGVIACAYGYGQLESYAYGGGASFKTINANSLIPVGGCLNDTLLFITDFKAPRHSFHWDLGDGTTSDEPFLTHIYTQLGTYKVTLILTDNCLDKRDTVSRDLLVTLRQAAAVDGDVADCVGGAVQLQAEDLAGATYEWRGPSGYFSQEQNPYLNNLMAAMGGTYSVVGIISGCASFPAESEVTVYPLPEPYLGQDTVVCPDESYPLLELYPGDFRQYSWSNHTVSPYLKVYDEGRYVVSVTDDNGCTGSDSIAVRAICPSKYYIPNVFSPNDDGSNDYFQVFSKDIFALDLLIFDRWGNKVFETHDIDGRWDGYFRGQPVDPAVFTWVAKIGGYRRDGTTYEAIEKGSVTVIR